MTLEAGCDGVALLGSATVTVGSLICWGVVSYFPDLYFVWSFSNPRIS